MSLYWKVINHAANERLNSTKINLIFAKSFEFEAMARSLEQKCPGTEVYKFKLDPEAFYEQYLISLPLQRDKDRIHYARLLCYILSESDVLFGINMYRLIQIVSFSHKPLSPFNNFFILIGTAGAIKGLHKAYQIEFAFKIDRGRIDQQNSDLLLTINGDKTVKLASIWPPTSKSENSAIAICTNHLLYLNEDIQIICKKPDGTLDESFNESIKNKQKVYDMESLDFFACCSNLNVTAYTAIRVVSDVEISDQKFCEIKGSYSGGKDEMQRKIRKRVNFSQAADLLYDMVDNLFTWGSDAHCIPETPLWSIPDSGTDEIDDIISDLKASV